MILLRKMWSLSSNLWLFWQQKSYLNCRKASDYAEVSGGDRTETVHEHKDAILFDPGNADFQGLGVHEDEKPYRSGGCAEQGKEGKITLSPFFSKAQIKEGGFMTFPWTTVVPGPRWLLVHVGPVQPCESTYLGG